MQTEYVCSNGLQHSGKVLEEKDDYKAIACTCCGFVHVVPFPSVEDLSDFYRSRFYEVDRKRDYFQQQQADQEWWHRVFQERLNGFERALGRKGRILDIGCGPGFFLHYAHNQGWDVLGVEPSSKAVDFASSELGIDVRQGDLSAFDVQSIGEFDVVYSHGVIEHVLDAHAFIVHAGDFLVPEGLLFINAANDFNPLQTALRNTFSYDPWWFVPPEHLNYFTVETIQKLVTRNAFSVISCSTSFPLELFLLMGDNYLKDPVLGKACHNRRVTLEDSLEKAGLGNLQQDLYDFFASKGLGRQIDLLARKVS